MKIALLHPDLQAGGGAEAYARSIQTTLQNRGHDVDIWDIHHPHWLLRWAQPLLTRFTLLKYALVCRIFISHRKKYDGVVGSFADTPCPKAWVVRHSPDVFASDGQNLTWNMVETRLWRKFYVRLCKWMAQPKNGACLVVNSPWTKARLRPALRRCSDVIVPPMNAPQSNQFAPRTRQGYVMIGRLVAHKKVLEGIAICQSLDRPLTIIGHGSGRYGRHVEEMAARNQNIRVLHMDEAQKWHALQQIKFGLHLAQHEHFGICVCEMIEAGVIPFVSAQSGAADIVKNQDYIFHTLEELTAKIQKAEQKGPATLKGELFHMRRSPLFQAVAEHQSQLGGSFRRWEKLICH